MTPQQELLLLRVEKKLDKVIALAGTPKWLDAGEVLKLTGWSYKELYNRRKAGVIESKRVKSQYFYNANTIPYVEPRTVGGLLQTVANLPLHETS